MDDHTLTIRLDYKGLKISHKIPEEILGCIADSDIIASVVIEPWDQIKLSLT